MVHLFRVNFQAGGKLKWHPRRNTHRRDTYCIVGMKVERKRKTSRVFIRLLYYKKFIGSSWTDFARCLNVCELQYVALDVLCLLGNGDTCLYL